MNNHKQTINDDFFIPVSSNNPPPTNISVADLKKLRREAFDRWCWETGNEEDKKLFEKLDGMLEAANQHSPGFSAHSHTHTIFVDNDKSSHSHTILVDNDKKV